MSATLDDLFAGAVDLLWSLPDGGLSDRTDAGFPDTNPIRGILPGSFNPLHAGHAGLRAAAEQWLGGSVVFELSVANVDKPGLGPDAVRDRLSQFETPVLLTNAPTFARKAALIGSVVFVVGADTAKRIVDDRYCGPGESVESMLDSIRERDCRFLVAARDMGQGLLTLDGLPTARRRSDLFTALPASVFRLDVSSSALRGE